MKPSNSGGVASDGLMIASGQRAVLKKRTNRSREIRRASDRATKKDKDQEMRLRWLLYKDNQRLCIPRSDFLMRELGIHVVNDRNFVVAQHCSVEALLEEIENG